MRIIKVYAVIFAILTSPNALSTPQWLTSYNADYKVYWHGIRVGTSNQKLEVTKNGYKASTKTVPHSSIVPFYTYAYSDFMLNNNKIVSQKYSFDHKEKQRHLSDEIIFVRDKNQIYSKTEQRTMFPINKSIDEISVGFALKLDIINYEQKHGSLPINQSFKYLVFKKDKLEDMVFKIESKEFIKTKIGEIECLKVTNYSHSKRHTNIWFSLEHNLSMVKMNQYRKGKKSSELIINNFNNI